MPAAYIGAGAAAIGAISSLTGGSGSNTTTSQSGPDPRAMQAYLDNLNRAQGIAGQPLQQYSGPMVAGFTPMQQQGFQGIENAQGIANPYINAAAQYAGQSATPINVPGGLNNQQLTGLARSGVNYTNQAANTNIGAAGMPGIYGAQSGVNYGTGQAAQGAGNAMTAANAGANTALGAANKQYDVSQYMSPYTQSVVNATQNQFNLQNAQQQQNVIGDAISKGAWGGDRAAVAQAQLAGQQQTAQAPVIAGLYNQGYGNAQQEFNTQQALQAGMGIQAGQLGMQAGLGSGQLGLSAGQLGAQTGIQQAGLGQSAAQQQAALKQQAAQQQLGLYGQQQQAGIGAQEASGWLASNAGSQMGALGQQAQSSALTNANALMSAGNQQQQLSQEQLNIPYEQFLQQQAYPFQTENWYSGILDGTASGMGGQSSTTSPGPNPLSQALGLGVAGYGIGKDLGFGSTGSSGSYNSYSGPSYTPSSTDYASSGADGLNIRRGGRVPGFAPGGPVQGGAPQMPMSGFGQFATPIGTFGGGPPIPQQVPPMAYGGRAGFADGGTPSANGSLVVPGQQTAAPPTPLTQQGGLGSLSGDQLQPGAGPGLPNFQTQATPQTAISPSPQPPPPATTTGTPPPPPSSAPLTSAQNPPSQGGFGTLPAINGSGPQTLSPQPPPPMTTAGTPTQAGPSGYIDPLAGTPYARGAPGGFDGSLASVANWQPPSGQAQPAQTTPLSPTAPPPMTAGMTPSQPTNPDWISAMSGDGGGSPYGHARGGRTGYAGGGAPAPGNTAGEPGMTPADVASMYGALLGRGVDPEGGNYWTGKPANTAAQGVMTTPEYQARPSISGFTDAPGRAGIMIPQLKVNATQAPSWSGQNNADGSPGWMNPLAQYKPPGTVTTPKAAPAIAQTTSTAKSSANDVKALYKNYLGRDASDADMKAIGMGDLSDADVAKSILGSDEYKSYLGTNPFGAPSVSYPHSTYTPPMAPWTTAPAATDPAVPTIDPSLIMAAGGGVTAPQAGMGFDDGGMIPPGVDPSTIGLPVMGGNQMAQQQYQHLQQMPIEKLHELAQRVPPTTPQGSLIHRALSAKRMNPGLDLAQQSQAQAALSPPMAYGGRAGFDEGGGTWQPDPDSGPSFPRLVDALGFNTPERGLAPDGPQQRAPILGLPGAVSDWFGRNYTGTQEPGMAPGRDAASLAAQRHAGMGATHHGSSGAWNTSVMGGGSADPAPADEFLRQAGVSISTDSADKAPPNDFQHHSSLTPRRFPEDDQIGLSGPGPTAAHPGPMPTRTQQAGLGAPPGVMSPSASSPEMAPPADADLSGRTPNALNPTAGMQPPDRESDVHRYASSPWLALAASGAGMAASGSPHFGEAVGQGLQAGIKTLEGQRGEESKEDYQKGEIAARNKSYDLEGKRLAQSLAEFHDRQAETHWNHQNLADSRDQNERFHQDEIGLRQSALDQGRWSYAGPSEDPSNPGAIFYDTKSNGPDGNPVTKVVPLKIGTKVGQSITPTARLNAIDATAANILNNGQAKTAEEAHAMAVEIIDNTPSAGKGQTKAPSWAHTATGKNGQKLGSNDGQTWFNLDGSPYQP